MLHPRNQPQANNGVHEHPLFAVTERLKVPPRNRTRLLALALENAAISLGTEPGCYQYHVCADPELPDIVLLYGLFLDRDAFETHVASDHCKSFHRSSVELVERREIHMFSEVWH